MTVHRSRPNLQDLYHLAEQVEQDRERAISELRQRDHAIARSCQQQSDEARLLYWLDSVVPADQGKGWQAESSWVYIARGLALLLGFSAMAGFLLSSSRGLVNAFVLLALFVGLQLLMSLFASFFFVRTVSGRAPATLPASPMRLLVLRSLPDRRYLREAASVLRLLLMRYCQEFAVLFTAAALAAFIAVPAITDFAFVWGSTFSLSDHFVLSFTDAMAGPWSSVWPEATLSSDIIAGSRYHPALTNLDREGIDSMRGWWGFLFMSITVYALLPRLLLWAASRLATRHMMRRAFVQFPGADMVLNRMRAPLVTTQSSEHSDEAVSEAQARAAVSSGPSATARVLLLDWSGALGAESVDQFEELLSLGLAQDNILSLGFNQLQRERELLQEKNKAAFDQLAVVVKSWEPPMAELADILAELDDIPRCTLYLVPLPGKSVPHRKVEDWRRFVREQAFASVDVQLLNRVTPI
ncbi:DUF2868 domain-containing protein [Parahaliea sp. F7430]|uniref:DUF2868 domain-containing protein n=1 Tax=Sediminihaliea albiluteola TaxID=2758564 RepID=A0A7W2TV00_9GAMM|nr:DUF2868 domain-containing protein [Sediminihaliea albiluteola]MBA6412455.1 DUF2868 domain-containing protein [Sediminihaliea albiluteola]